MSNKSNESTKDAGSTPNKLPSLRGAWSMPRHSYCLKNDSHKKYLITRMPCNTSDIHLTLESFAFIISVLNFPIKSAMNLLIGIMIMVKTIPARTANPS